MSFELSISGMTCGNCAKSIESMISDVEGVEDVRIDFDKKVVNVFASEAKKDEVVKVVNNSGIYTAS